MSEIDIIQYAVKVAAGLLGVGSIYILVWREKMEPATYLALITGILTTIGLLSK